MVRFASAPYKVTEIGIIWVFAIVRFGDAFGDEQVWVIGFELGDGWVCAMDSKIEDGAKMGEFGDGWVQRWSLAG